MPTPSSATPVRIAIIGAGQVSDYHHVPGIRLDSRAELAQRQLLLPPREQAARIEQLLQQRRIEIEEILDQYGVPRVNTR